MSILASRFTTLQLVAKSCKTLSIIEPKETTADTSKLLLSAEQGQGVDIFRKKGDTTLTLLPSSFYYILEAFEIVANRHKRLSMVEAPETAVANL